MSFFRSVLAVLLVACPVCWAQTVEWRHPSEHGFSPAVLYPNETAPTGFVVTSADHWLVRFRGDGKFLYRALDVWWPLAGGDWSCVYQTDRFVVPSRRWEAERDGIEDYRAFYVLDAEIKRAQAAGRTRRAAEAQALMHQACKDVIGWQIATIDEITRQTRDYEIDYDLLMDYRVKIKDAVLGLRGRVR